jgi:hypothetical protein
MVVPTRKKQIHLNFFDIACTGSHMAIGDWKYAYPYISALTLLISNKNLIEIQIAIREKRTRWNTICGWRNLRRKGKLHQFFLLILMLVCYGDELADIV